MIRDKGPTCVEQQIQESKRRRAQPPNAPCNPLSFAACLTLRTPVPFHPPWPPRVPANCPLIVKCSNFRSPCSSWSANKSADVCTGVPESDSVRRRGIDESDWSKFGPV